MSVGLDAVATGLAVIAALVAGCGLRGAAHRPRQGHGRARRTARQPLDVAVAEWCERAARQLRSGSSLPAALRAASTDASSTSIPTPLRDLAAALARGVPVRQALDRADVTGSAVGLALSTARTCAALRGPAAPALERAAASLRTRAAIADEVAAQSAQARLSAVVLTSIPLIVLAVLLAAEPDVRAQLQQPVGIGVVTAGVAFNVVGWLWMRRLTRRPA